MSFSVYFIIGSLLTEPLLEPVSYYCERLDVSEAGEPFYIHDCEVWKRTLCRDHADAYLALDLPWFGDGREVTSSHHHGPTKTIHDLDWLFVCMYVCWYRHCRYVCLCLHDNLFARRLQHHVLSPFIPALVGLGLVHDLLKHRPLPAQKQSSAPVLISVCVTVCLALMCFTGH